MKAFKGLSILLIALSVGLIAVGTGIAGNGKGFGGNGQGLRNGDGPIVDLSSGEAVELTGTVADAGSFGQGIGIDNGTEVFRVYGIGPIRYWNEMGVDRPTVGDAITIQGYEVTFSDGSSKIIAVKIIIDDTEIQLRDPETGAPLWRKTGFAGRGVMPRDCPYAQAVEEPEAE